MKNYKVGEVYDFDGQERKVLGIDAQGFPVTTTDLDYEPKEEAPVVADGMERAYKERIEVLVKELEALKKELVEARSIAGQANEVAMQSAKDEFVKCIPLDKLNKDELLEVASFIGTVIEDEKATNAEIIALIQGGQ